MASRKKVTVTSPSRSSLKDQNETPCSNAALMKKLTGIDKIVRDLRNELLDVSSKVDVLLEVYQDEEEEETTGSEDEIEEDSDDEM